MKMMNMPNTQFIDVVNFSSLVENQIHVVIVDLFKLFKYRESSFIRLNYPLDGLF